MSELYLLEPDWPLPAGVQAFVSTRLGGVSAAPYASLNLGLHVDDDAQAVAQNRALLLTELEARTGQRHLQVQWIRQVHGTVVHEARAATAASVPEADAIHCRETGLVLAVMTADCLPVLFASDTGDEIAVAHAGWRGLLAGVLEASAARLREPSAALAWLGPAIGPCHFEVGDEVRAAFLNAATAAEAAATKAAFQNAPEPGKWFADLYALARLRLARAGLTRVYGAPRCTVCEARLWYSYRGEGRTGRFASLIVLAPVPKEMS
ncbi:MAG: peptidoglycan editing factor PgeF [Pseudomonadales bacterium]|jgi:YfiH family protein|nr:peptidoglycan editing factor PgeF [Pseudomonadales bacterium]